MPTCVVCDTALLPDRPFCGGCGTRVTTPPPTPSPSVSGVPACRCGAPLTGAFCGACGTPRPATAPAPATPMPAWTPSPAQMSPQQHPTVRPGRPAWPTILVLVVPFVTLVVTWAMGTLALVEALVLWVLVLVATAVAWAVGWVGSRGRQPTAPALVAPELQDRELVYSRFGVEHGPVTAAELGRIAAADRLPPTTQVRDTEGGAWFPLGELVRTASRKSFGAALALAFFLGALGGHWFYLGRPGLGLLRLATWGGTMALAVVAISEASQVSYDAYYGTWSTGQSEELLTALWVSSIVIAMWSLFDLILVGTRSVRDGEGRKLE